MSKIEHSALLEFSAQQMYDLVNQVDRYPEFLPWCAASEILAETDDSMTAMIKIKKGIIEKAFTTENQLIPTQSITMNLINGPFKSMQGLWQFKTLSDTACKTSFSLEFTFDSKLLALTLTPIFTKIADTMIGAFQQRALDIYGENDAS
jgi:ribosome-associated toxin RatA of RatAB toxin-antitoxin module